MRNHCTILYIYFESIHCLWVYTRTHLRCHSMHSIPTPGERSSMASAVVSIQPRQRLRIHRSLGPQVQVYDCFWSIYGAFPKQGYPQIIHHCKPSILGYPHLWKLPYVPISNQLLGVLNQLLSGHHIRASGVL